MTAANKPAAKRPAAKKPPKTATGEPGAVEVLGVPITHPARVLYPDDALSKLDIARYHEAVAEWTLREVAGRPVSVVRCPDGIASGEPRRCFFQKHLPYDLPPGLHGARLDEHAPYLYVKDARGLVALTQVGVLEIHAWGSTVAHPDEPDRLVLDLDPGPGVPWDRVKDTAAALRTRLADLDLASFLKTTGGKGLHVVVPLTRGRQSWDDVKAFARGLALELVHAAPDMFTASASKAGRSGKIYLDYLRNSRGATSIAAYSPRARPGAPVAVPLRWDELSALTTPQKYSVETLHRRLASLKRDPWAELARTRQSLRASLLREVRGRAA
jgi:bifunctional non-homologous end joining protein LigD